jgi:hypothetical protein
VERDVVTRIEIKFMRVYAQHAPHCAVSKQTPGVRRC